MDNRQADPESRDADIRSPCAISTIMPAGRDLDVEFPGHSRGRLRAQIIPGTSRC